MLTLDEATAPCHRRPVRLRPRLSPIWPKLAEAHAGSEQELRRAVAQRLKTLLAEGRNHAEQALLNDRRRGRRGAPSGCAS